MMSAAFLAVGLFSFAIWLVRRRDPIYFLVFVMALCAVNQLRRAGVIGAEIS